MNRILSHAPLRPAPITVLTCQSTADFLTSLPLLLGYTARQSVVLVLFEGTRARQAVRFALPPAHIPHEDSGVRASVLALLGRLPAVTGVALVVYTDETFASQHGTPRALFATWLTRQIERSGFTIVDACVVAADGWASYREHPRTVTGRPLAELVTHPGLGADSLEQPVTDISELGTLPPGDAELSALLAAELVRDQVRCAPEDRAEISRVIAALSTVSEQGVAAPTIRACAILVEASRLTPGWLALAFGIATDASLAARGIDLRDSAFTEHRALLEQTGETSASDLAALLYRFSAERVAPEQLRSAIADISRLTAHTPATHRSGLLALLAWMWWMGGMSSPALLQIAEALTLTPDHEPSRAMKHLIEETPPLWLFARERSASSA